MSPTPSERNLEARAALCGNGLRRLREHMVLSLRRASAAACVDPGHLSRIERGQGKASAATLERLANAYYFASADKMVKRAEKLAKWGGGR